MVDRFKILMIYRFIFYKNKYIPSDQKIGMATRHQTPENNNLIKALFEVRAEIPKSR